MSCRTFIPTPISLQIPSITLINPDTISISDKTATIFITGINFNIQSVVTMNDVKCVSFYNTSNQLGFYIPSTMWIAGTYNIQVSNANNQIYNTQLVQSNIVLLTLL